jgi:hypothetical protein
MFVEHSTKPNNESEGRMRRLEVIELAQRLAKEYIDSVVSLSDGEFKYLKKNYPDEEEMIHKKAISLLKEAVLEYEE